ncbi:hypothetical protein F442_23214 [Phytophthora nicotianae P10297]|uniref:Uncharacterized protein n=2 Tax=Phytophthora nicotianae TaxID=4792 RepID=W2XXE2_PHYNI|nr:hypothetical protein F442_23214 [Phytophthora nicotianae P10297]
MQPIVKSDKKGIDELRMMTQLGDISLPKNSKDFFKKIDWIKTLEKLSDSMEDLEKQDHYSQFRKMIKSELTMH